MARIKFSWVKTFDRQLPLRENCDPLDPRQVLLAAFTGFGVKGAPLMLPIEFWESLSEHLIEYLGVPVQTDGEGPNARTRLLQPLGEGLGWVPRRKYIPPTTVLNSGTAAGRWVTMDEPEPAQESVTEALQRMTKQPAVDGIPATVLVKDFRKLLGLSHAHMRVLLDGWGVPNARPDTRIDRGLAARIIAHLQRAKSAREQAAG